MSEKQRCLPALIAVVAALSAQVVMARWHAVAQPPRPDLPAVEIDLGYPGGYVPRSNSPVVLRAVSGEKAFDGYIGYHIAVDDRMTVDVPVIARAVLPARSTWTFSTFLQLMRSAGGESSYLARREVVIEWLDPALNLIAQRNVGVPPWIDVPRPLRIASPGEQSAVSYLGETAVVVDASALSKAPQWYAGFSEVVIPISRWFELPNAIRETIFRSGLHVVFFGIPERIPAMNAIDRALLPIELRPAASAVAVPWPFGDGTIPAPVSWRAKKGAHIAGSIDSPYLVTNGVATFAADEKAVRVGLPAFTITPAESDVTEISRHSPTIAEFAREQRPALVFAFVFILCIATWIVFRRLPRVAVLAVTVGAALAILGWRNAIHPASGTHRFERLAIAAPGVVDVVTVRNDYGAAPSRVPQSEAQAQTSAVTFRIGDRVGGDTELRTSRTTPGFGQVDTPGRPWFSTARASTWRELGEPATIRVRSRDAKQLVVEYHGEEPFNYISAEWMWNGKFCYGDAHLDSRRDVGTVRCSTDVWPRLGIWWALNDWWEKPRGDGTRVTLLRVERDRTFAVREVIPDESPSPRSYSMFSPLRRDPNEKHSTMFFLPAPVSPHAAVTVSFPMFGPASQAKSITLSGPGGSMPLDPKWTGRMPIGAEVRGADVQRIAPAGGIVRVDVEAAGTSVVTASFRVRERSQ